MLSSNKKATILAKAGVTVPPFPARRLPVQERHLRRGLHAPAEELAADLDQRVAVRAWDNAIEGLFRAFLSDRAARSSHAGDVEADGGALTSGAR